MDYYYFGSVEHGRLYRLKPGVDFFFLNKNFHMIRLLD